MSKAPMLVDSHCHLDYPDFAGDFDAVLERARQAGVGTMLSIATRLDRFAEVEAIAEAHRDIYCSIGIHPHEAKDAGEGVEARLLEIAARPKVVGIGETGLDYYYTHSPREAQQDCFRSHIRAALQAHLPLIVHTRDADADTIRILREEKASKGLIHCFSTSRQLAEEAMDIGFYISLSGIVTFPKAEDLRATVRNLPLDRLLVETDAPYLAPVPRRGKRNEPAFVAHTAARVAELKGVTVEELARRTTANFFALFGKARPPAAP